MGILLYLGVGLLAGLFAGLFGLGGGVVLIPLLVYLFEMSQKEAQGTSLMALIPPVGILAAWQYVQGGHVTIKDHLPLALWIALGLLLGGFFGGKLVTFIKPVLLRQLFGALVVFVGLRMILRP
ncbi:TSUP family transporter [bacterium]|nr:TSUP family transporter [bacterium]